MRRPLAIVGLIAALAAGGCAYQPEDYVAGPGASQAGASAAYAQCREKADTIPATTNGAQNPFYAGAMQAQYMQDCMAAAGYHLAN